MELEQLKKQYINAIYETKALMIKDKQFELRQGGKSHIYLNHRKFITKPEYLKLIAELYLKLIPSKDFKIACVDSVMSPIIAGAMSAISGKEIIVIKEEELGHGTQEDVYGELTGEVIIVDDMTTSGTLLVNATKKIRKNNAAVKYAVVSACRDKTAENKLKDLGVKLLYITNFQEIIRELFHNLTEKEQELVKKENILMI